MSQDPIGLEGGINGYTYAANDPVNLTDPSGLAPFCFMIREQAPATGFQSSGGYVIVGQWKERIVCIPIGGGAPVGGAPPPPVSAVANFINPGAPGSVPLGDGFSEAVLKSVPTHDPEYDVCTANFPGMGLASALSPLPIVNHKLPGDLMLKGSSWWTTIDRRMPAWTGAKVNAGLPVRVAGTAGRVKYLGRYGTASWVIGAAGFLYGAGGRAYCLNKTYGSFGL